MSTEINTKDQIAAMLSAKLNEFLDGVGDSYGKVILDELVTRLEYTITDFKDEVGEIMEQMLENAANKKEILSNLIARESSTSSGDDVDISSDSPQQSAGTDDSRDMSEWEKKLEKLG
ncbi:MAG: hypothetical protein VYA09_06290 [Candidatus Neomarinimicrobiota bacterium]|nr:hypothetical protein [Candidatus Neomarinimicrobiota bacterium]MEC9273628.1 hypothetical protein [Candidatus Neomarinimicrobiota bacterium]|tara:strand:- start:838 stop:1191 length:354 start_codon:yes stop_codon:yes gene_type:complete